MVLYSHLTSSMDYPTYEWHPILTKNLTNFPMSSSLQAQNGTQRSSTIVYPLRTIGTTPSNGLKTVSSRRPSMNSATILVENHPPKLRFSHPSPRTQPLMMTTPKKAMMSQRSCHSARPILSYKTSTCLTLAITTNSSGIKLTTHPKTPIKNLLLKLRNRWSKRSPSITRNSVLTSWMFQ